MLLTARCTWRRPRKGWYPSVFLPSVRSIPRLTNNWALRGVGNLFFFLADQNNQTNSQNHPIHSNNPHACLLAIPFSYPSPSLPIPSPPPCPPFTHPPQLVEGLRLPLPLALHCLKPWYSRSRDELLSLWKQIFSLVFPYIKYDPSPHQPKYENYLFLQLYVINFGLCVTVNDLHFHFTCHYNMNSIYICKKWNPLIYKYFFLSSVKGRSVWHFRNTQQKAAAAGGCWVPL